MVYADVRDHFILMKEALTNKKNSDHATLDQSIFRAYDVRGIYPSQINEETAYLIGRGFATYLLREHGNELIKVAVGSDMRLSSPALKQKVIDGILDTGINVDDFGLVSTPTFYFGVAFFGYTAGLQVSASHNPKEWNGFKFVRRRAEPISKHTGLDEIRRAVATDDFAPPGAERGELGYMDDVLINELKVQLDPAKLAKIKPLKIVLDGSNAMGSLDLEAFFTKIPCTVSGINLDLDGSFPAHEADPMKPENTEQIRACIVEEQADLGVMMDGDGDRVFIFDERGRAVSPATIRAVLAEIVLGEMPGSTIVYEVRPGRITRDVIDRMGGRGIVTPAGSPHIKEAMLRESAVFGGEMSGHYFFKLSYGVFEAPMVLLQELLVYFSERAGMPVSELLRPYERYVHSGEINIPVADAREIRVRMERVRDVYSKGTLNMIDGITIEYPDFWFNLRASNTEPLIRLNMEGMDPEVVRRETDRIKALISS